MSLGTASACDIMKHKSFPQIMTMVKRRPEYAHAYNHWRQSHDLRTVVETGCCDTVLPMIALLVAKRKVSDLCFCENLSSFGPSFAQVKACAISAIVNFVANNQIMH